jgi:hypothetical protein
MVDGIPFPPPVRPVIILKGSDFELGYQYFQQLVQIYGPWLSSQRGGWLYFSAPLHRESYSSEQKDALRQYDSYVKEYTPEWVEILHGMVAGAADAGIELTYDDLLAFYSLYEEFLPWSDKSFVMPPQPCCSAFAAWGTTTKGGRLICAGNGDDNIGFFSSTVVVFPTTGNAFVASPYNNPGFGGFPSHPGMNNKGLVHVHHGTGKFDFPDRGYTVPRGFANMHILRFAGSAREAAEMHLALPKAVNCKDGNFFADVSGDAMVVERRNPPVVRRAGDLGETDFLYHTNNYLARENGDETEQDFIPHAGWLSKELKGLEEMDCTAWSVSRNLYMWNMLHNYQGEVDVDFATMMYRFPSTLARRTLEAADEAYRAERGQTYRARIGSLDNSVIGIIQPDDGDDGRYYICHGPATRNTGPAMPTLHNYGPGQTYSFFELRLASDPAAVAQAALTRAQTDLYYANTAMGALSYLEAAPLESPFDKAKTEYFKGHYFLNSVLCGRIADEREAVFSLARATRAYTRCQVYAKQVSEAITPPPSRPEHLGLRPWMGDGGDWDRFFEGD